MTITYEKQHDTRALGSAIKKWHPVLDQVGVTVDWLFATDVDEETGESRHCLKEHGYPAAATIKITPLKYRALGVADAILIVDEATWHELDAAGQVALLDHELAHIQVRGADCGIVTRDGDGVLDRSAKLDDLRRPVLRLRPHDWQLGGFRDVARRHREDAIEVRDVRRHQERGGQYAWDFDVAEDVDDFLAQPRPLEAVQ